VGGYPLCEDKGEACKICREEKRRPLRGVPGEIRKKSKSSSGFEQQSPSLNETSSSGRRESESSELDLDESRWGKDRTRKITNGNK
jgi:hypothetical protein